MKKTYMRSEVVIVNLDASDVIATSSGITLAGGFNEGQEDGNKFSNLFPSNP